MEEGFEAAMERARQRELAETNFNPQAAEALRAVSEAVAPPATQQRPHSSGGRGGDMVFAAPQTAMLSTSGSLFPPVRPGSDGTTAACGPCFHDLS